MSTQTQSHKFAAVILQNLPEVPEDRMQSWIENPRALQQLLAGLNPPINGSATVTEFPVWKTVKLRTGIDADGYRKLIEGKKVGTQKMRIGDYANDILGKPAFTVVTEETELDLVVVSVKELTGKNEAPLKEIFARAKEKGLQLCPNQVGPELRLQYEDQSKGEWVIIGMEPITDSDGDLSLFRVVHGGGGLWLDANYGCPDSIWDGDYRFVFVLPRK